jgi:hypothetical protein
VYEIKAKEIRDRAKAENRFLAPWEEAQTRTLERAALCSVLYRALEETFKRWEVEFGEANKLTKKQLKMLNLLARRGVPFAQKMLQDRENNLSASVHSRNSICATISGRNQTHFFIFSAVNASPHRALWVSGRFTNGHFKMTSGFSFSNSLRREAGTNPFLVRAT